MSHTTEERKRFAEWLNAQDMGSIPEMGFESIEGDLSYLAYQAGRASMHKSVLEWDKPLIGIIKDHGNFVHISDSLGSLK